MTGNLCVIALGGNAIKQSHERGTTEEQFRNVDIAAQQIADLARQGYKLVITHGNGPQVGSLLIQQEGGEPEVPGQNLAVCGAMTQGQIGWMLQNRISYHLEKLGIRLPVCSIVTQVEISQDDPDFQNPSKPVGPFYTKTEAEALKISKNYLVREVKPGTEKSWRRIVPSPKPLRIVEQAALTTLVESGAIVIASGGGGIPVARHEDGSFQGIDAVIDKDRAGVILAKAVRAEKFIILTDVETVYLNYNTPDAIKLETSTVEEAEKYAEAGHFLRGSMEPKMEAAMEFVRWSRGEAIITSLESASEALQGNTGTRILYREEIEVSG